MRERHRPNKMDKGSWFAGLTLLAVLASSACGTLEMRDLKDSFGSKTEGTENTDQDWATVRVGLTPSQVLTTKLTESNFAPDEFSLFAFDLVNAASMQFKVSGCASGYVVNATPVASHTATMLLYKTDKNCEVGLVQFDYDSKTYQPTGGATELKGASGNSAIFQASTGEELKVRVYKQLLASGVTDGMEAAFTFLKSTKGADANVVNYTAGSPLNVNGIEAPAFSIASIELTDIASVGGAGTFRFTLQCAQNLTQTGSDWECPRVNGETDPQKIIHMAVKLVHDAANKSTYTFSEIETLMASGTTVVNNIMKVGASATNIQVGNMVGPGQLVTHKQMLLIMSYTDPSTPSRGTSYKYFNVDIGDPTL